MIYFAKLKSEEDVIKHVTESLRIEEEDLSKLDFSLLAKLAKIYRRSAVVHLVSELTLLKGQTQ